MSSPPPDALAGLSALEARDRIAAGDLSARDYTDVLIAVTQAREPELRAWVHFDPNRLRREADRLDAARASGAAPGPLHGLPVGAKDIIDTADMPTENGAALDRGRKPDTDAAVVARLKAAGGIVMGKTVTTELAFLHPSITRNPANHGHTPGGSSSGSAAAVAAGMVPLAIGTQTGGSVIRPAAFCGVVGFKPSFGAIQRDGVLSQSPSLDTLGVFARNPEDAALLFEQFSGADSVWDAEPAPARLRLAHPPGWSDVATAETRAALEGLAREVCDLPTADMQGTFRTAADQRARINLYEMAQAYRRYMERPDLLSATTRRAIEEGARVTREDYEAALAARTAMLATLDDVFGEADVLLAPSAPGPAPEGFQTTGDAIFNGLWTLLGTPAITLPLFVASNGLPMGVQLVGRPREDARLVRAACDLYATHHPQKSKPNG